ncbi:Lrp/AsnC family transcriptional regulator [Ottowia thiooxydans]|uniref:Lrp/AsnC family transcriptional regulator n=1 Tax=Ottowia thiooxydans TaxID=219182 RepID=UPI00041C53FF|nr:Lrp/AsnC family transcriptional regulator [Ottowia thiooxydans]
MELDSYDIKLLGLLQKNSKTPQRQLSEAVNLSASAVNRRIAQYEASGLITATVAVVDPVKAGRPITLAVEVKVESERLDLLDEIKQRFSACSQVQQAYYITGDFDFLLIFNVQDMVEYEKLTRELFFSSSNIKAFRTIVVMQTLKASLAVPLSL